MTELEAARYISKLTVDEKRKLNELLKVLEQKRQLSQALPTSTSEDAQ